MVLKTDENNQPIAATEAELKVYQDNLDEAAGVMGQIWAVLNTDIAFKRQSGSTEKEAGIDEKTQEVSTACGLAATTLFGLFNGLLITRIKLPPFIVTLGTLNIAFAITQIYSEAQTVTDLPPVMTALGNTFNLGNTEVGYGTVVMIGLYVLAWFMLRESAPGRHIYAVGNSPEAARLTGIPVDRVILGVYALAGLFYGIAALLSVARTGVGDPQAGQTEDLDAITAVVLGGTSLFGGRGIILGTLVGAVIVGVFRNGLTLMGVASVYQTLITGILVILAVAADQMSRKGAR